MPCIERARSWAGRAGAPVAALLTALLLLGGCAQLPRLGGAPAPQATPPTPPAAAAPAPAARVPAPASPPASPAAAAPARPPAPSAQAQGTPGAAANRGPMPRQPRYVALPPPATPRSAAELQRQFAQRLVASHPDGTYAAPAPDRLLAIPVLEVALNADGSVRDIKVLRRPSTGNEATALAIAAVRRAAPYGNVARLPRPWTVVETFLFDDNLRFKPRTLDLD